MFNFIVANKRGNHYHAARGGNCVPWGIKKQYTNQGTYPDKAEHGHKNPVSCFHFYIIFNFH
ncbi:MAG: hypothetical protein A2W90_14470 [Bacteroidetes bacterium GWF2_42_66]|nr:MAG: hypothetical protein A2W92_15865 [Bacteroidetes bacterium GWA2_42_15]OFX99100.1 MAG: hypothetical protein A2W89_06790 [Bacteroidetes bacterium GWE2_42_39]OFY46731.1 MAG: hypothetical protein A2W90_14470 [Bacteroidetes bacterium GWF2_42_66]HBL73863.1 hypothetical protein [Prolixibacteraceae bacterium]HCU63204.1 hypothetical protein [Prolixibacteraceae bacterium]